MKCVGVSRKVKITVCAMKVAVDMYVIRAKGEGYPIILGRTDEDDTEGLEQEA